MLAQSAPEEQRHRPQTSRLQLKTKGKSQGADVWEVTDPTSRWAVVQELVAYLRQGKGMVKRRYKRTETRKRAS